MPSYVITGASRSIGYEWLRQFSSDPQSIVVGLVRNKAQTEKKVSEDAELKSRTNIHILEADITDYNALKKAAARTAALTGGSLDYLIANAGLITEFDAFHALGELGDKPEELTKTMRDLNEVNVIGNIHLINAFMPLILKGEVKKVIVLSTGYADVEFTNKHEIWSAPLYSISKAATNMVVAKFHAQYKKDGVLFISISPGTVEVGLYDNLNDEQKERLGQIGAMFMAYAPSFKGPYTPEQSVSLMRTVIDHAGVDRGFGGDYVSQFGNKQWL